MIKVALEYTGVEHDVEISEWIKSNCTSVVRREYVDMSDISSWQGPDDLMEYYFDSTKEAIMFKLRWSNG